MILVCVCVFTKLHIIAQSGLVILVILCSCVQDISVISCEENIMFWEVSGIGTEVIFSRVISFSDCTL